MTAKTAKTDRKPFSMKSVKLPTKRAEMQGIMERADKEMLPHRRKLEMSRRITEKDLLARFQ
ncbi:MAG: hypothetical protein NTX53_05280 [candidate division WOR-3 bacterium]|nr:hypothetical protein [candidate division WOR-3 bacterium]